MPFYQWLYGSHGGEWKDASESIPSQAQLLMHPELNPDFLADRNMLNDLRECIEQSGGGLDMTILERKRVLMAPPHWNYIVEALDRTGQASESNQPDAARFADDSEAIRKYAEMLRGTQKGLDQALFWASIASTASPAHVPSERMKEALEALPVGGNMHGAPPSWVKRISRSLRPSLKEAQVQPWFVAMVKRHQKIQQMRQVTPPGPGERAEMLDRTDESWNRRAKEFLETGRNSFPVETDDLLGKVARRGPANLFDNDLQEMTVRLWTNALVSLWPERTKKGTMLDMCCRALDLRDGQPVSILVAKDSDSSAAWKPLRDRPCMWTKREDAPRLSFVFGEILTILPPSIGIFFELSDESEFSRIDTEVFERIDYLGPAPRQFACFGKMKIPKNVSPAIPYIENPGDLADLLRQWEHLQPKLP